MDSWAPNSASSEERISFPPEDVGVKVELNMMFINEGLVWFGVLNNLTTRQTKWAPWPLRSSTRSGWCPPTSWARTTSRRTSTLMSSEPLLFPRPWGESSNFFNSFETWTWTQHRSGYVNIPCYISLQRRLLPQGFPKDGSHRRSLSCGYGRAVYSLFLRVLWYENMVHLVWLVSHSWSTRKI